MSNKKHPVFVRADGRTASLCSSAMRGPVARSLLYGGRFCPDSRRSVRTTDARGASPATGRSQRGGFGATAPAAVCRTACLLLASKVVFGSLPRLTDTFSP